MKATTKASTTAHLILTGASGYLGQHLLSHWITNGVLPPSSAADQGAVQFQISALYHTSETFPKALQDFCQNKNRIKHPSISDVTARSIDLTDPSETDLQSLLSSDTTCDAIILVHAAALSSPRACQANPETARAINVPTKFLDAVLGASSASTTTTTTSIVALSTDQVYDGTQKSGSYYQEDETDGLKPVNIYGQTKLELENYLSKHQPQPQNASSSLMVALRSSIILGPPAPIDPDGAHGTFLDFCQSRGIAGEATTFFTNEYRSVVRVDKVISTIGGLVSKSVVDASSGIPSATLSSVVYNMGGPFRVNRMQLAKALFDKFGYDATLLLDAQQTSPMSPLDISMDSSLLLEDGILLKEDAPQDSNAYLKELVDYVFGV